MTFRLAFVTGATPDKWAGVWRQRHRESIELSPVEEAVQLDGLLAGEVEMALVRTHHDQPLDRTGLGLHLIALYDEQPVAMMGTDRELTLLDEVTTADLADEPQDWVGVSLPDVVATVAAGTGVLVVPMAVARLHHRRDVTYRPVSDLPPTSVGLAWRRDRDDERTQAFVGIVRGRSERSSRS